MSSKSRQHWMGFAAASLIILIIVLLISLWAAVRNGVFNANMPAAELRLKGGPPQNHTIILPNVTEPQRLPSEGEYVRPVKISPLDLHEDDLLYGSDQMRGEIPLRHHSGHYRHRMAHVWDPHPVYEFTAFHRMFVLVLEHDTDFAPPDLQITRVWGNTSFRDGPKLRHNGCFYSGHVEGDDQSLVSVSLCHGITGHIRTSRGNYFIQPLEESLDIDHMTPILHVIFEFPFRSANHCGIGDDIQPKRLRDHPEPDDYDIAEDSLPTNVSKRGKRSVLREYFVELMVFADRSMVDYHGPENIESYILALLHIVAGIFKDASIGNPITISVVKIQILDSHSFVKYRKPRHSGVSATDMLSEFCRYQAHSPVHHDTALLLTRENICRDLAEDKCETLGLAELGTVCEPQGSCSIVQDNGLSAAFTIAHELGHVLNMPHDGETYCRQYTNTQSHSHVMSNSHHEGTNPWQWSDCSRHIVTEFLESKHGECLRDRPSRDDLEERRNSALPGEQIMANQQCQLLYGRGSNICTYMPVCRELWCTKPDGEACQTLHMPWSDGTPCATGRWCQKGECVPRDPNKLKKINGQWGPWQEYGPCSRSCGGGTKRSVRECNNPRPENGGRYCVGTRVRYQSCETQDCPHDAKGFREVQCSEFDSNNRGIPGLSPNVQWLPKYGLTGDDRCNLYCRVLHTNSYFLLRDKVIDGTPCSPESFDVCVNGQCKPAGCDRILDSGMQLDICGKCGGLNDTCKLVRGDFNVPADTEGYRKVVLIPAGSSNLDIRQHSNANLNDDNYLALKQENGKGLLNNDFVLTTFRKIIPYGGTTLEYSGSAVAVERINASRPLKRDLRVEILSVGRLTAPDITYQYTIPKHNEDRYMWKHVKEWTDCDRLCHGKRTRSVSCYTDTNEPINESYCLFKPKPAPLMAACNTHCDLSWRVTGRSECSSHCGPGTRSVTKECVLVMLESEAVYPYDAIFCAHLPNTLPDVEKCEGLCDAAHWKYTEWSQCSKTCGSGIQQREAQCVDDLDRPIHSEKCSPHEKLIQRRCDLEKCPTYIYGNWSSCSVSCGVGTRTRQHWCQRNNQIVDMALCETGPVIHEPCTMPVCTRWLTSTWSQCSASCGTGSATRSVTCVTEDGYPVPEQNCSQEKPVTRQPCNTWKSCNQYPVYHVDDRENRIDFDFAWSVEPWSQCSVTCGGGTQYREVYCPARYYDPSSVSPCRSMKPPTARACAETPCPTSGKWITKEWSECSESCGLGVKQRQVLCQSPQGFFLQDSECSFAEPKPPTEMTCQLRPCQTFKWRRGKWTPCSQMCGIGSKTRGFHCIEEPSMTRVADSYCRHLQAPKKRLVPCMKKLCSFSWQTGPWSQCSASCNKGIETRNVSCHAVNEHQWLDPEPITSNYLPCDSSTRPVSTQDCLQRNCTSAFYWRFDGWTECSKPCGTKGMQHSKHSCRDTRGREVSKSRCRSLGRPARLHQICNFRSCSHLTCKEVQLQTSARTDGNYQLLVGGVNTTIYCKNMNTANPIEFLPLRYPEENFSWYSQVPSQHCPVDGVPLAKHKHQSFTGFEKLRLDVDRLLIYTNDYSFTNRQRGNRSALGELGTGHCYQFRGHSLRGVSNPCMQGWFSINLHESPFHIAPTQQWYTSLHTRLKIDRVDPQTLLGYCGGLCGHCRPSTNHAIKLHVLPP